MGKRSRTAATVLTSSLAVACLMAAVVYNAEVPAALLETSKLATISPYQARLAQSGGSHVVHAPSGKAAKWAKTMDNFFHPIKGMKLDDATRIRLDKVLHSAKKASKPAWMKKKAEKWQRLEDSTFHHTHQAVSDEDRLRIFTDQGEARKLTAKASKWQHWMDTNFGHSQADVAAARIGDVERARANIHHARAQRNVHHAGRKSLVDTLASKSWASQLG